MYEENTIINSFKFVDTLQEPGTGARLAANIITIHNKPSARRISIGSVLARDLAKNGFLSVRLAYNSVTGDYALVFFKNESGHILRGKVSGRRVSTVNINSEKLVSEIAKAFNVRDGASAQLELSINNSRRDDIRFYTLAKING